MSYIRPTSNDEFLYIFANMSGTVEFRRGENFMGTMPQDIFNALIDAWIENFCEDTEFHEANVRDIFVNDKPIIRLKYHEWYIDMQYVTWYYIARSNYGRSKPRWKLRLLKKFFGNII